MRHWAAAIKYGVPTILFAAMGVFWVIQSGSPWPAIFTVAVLALGPFATLTIAHVSPRAAGVHYVLSLVALLTLAGALNPLVPGWHVTPVILTIIKYAFSYSFVYACLACIVLLIDLFSGWMMFAHRPAPDPNTVNMQAVTASFENIKRVVVEARAAVSKESQGIEHTLGVLREAIEKQERDFQRARELVEAARREADKYKALAALTEAQQSEFLREMRRPRYLEMLVAWIGGLVTSLAAQYLWSLAQGITKK
jgi:hypothetical protein